jgi:hypothetical protein
MSRGKKSVSVDLKQPEGVNLVRKLCSRADVVIEPFRKGLSGPVICYIGHGTFGIVGFSLIMSPIRYKLQLFE